MRPRLPLLLAVVASLLLGARGVPQRIQIGSPGPVVDEFSFPIEFRVLGAIQPGSLEVELNFVSILDRVSGGP